MGCVGTRGGGGWVRCLPPPGGQTLVCRSQNPGGGGGPPSGPSPGMGGHTVGWTTVPDPPRRAACSCMDPLLAFPERKAAGSARSWGTDRCGRIRCWHLSPRPPGLCHVTTDPQPGTGSPERPVARVSCPPQGRKGGRAQLVCPFNPPSRGLYARARSPPRPPCASFDVVRQGSDNPRGCGGGRKGGGEPGSGG